MSGKRQARDGDVRQVIKASGELEPFRRRKVLNSLLNSGVRRADAEDIIDRVLVTVKPPLSTKKIFREARKLLRSYNLSCTMRYSLKEAIFALGPTGYPFERYVAKILSARGYKTEVGRTIKGHCVSHEVDVVAYKDDSCYIVECKFHQNGKTLSNVKTALYVHSRFRDIERAMSLSGAKPGTLTGMIVTNTRFSSEARKYARCVGLVALGWKHPRGESLELMIEEGRTYPVTVLPGLKRAHLDAMVRSGVILVQDIADRGERSLLRATKLDERTVARLKRGASQICG
jgi:predicted RecB family endonuclease